MAINAPVPRNGLRVLMMHDCLIEVTRFDSGESAIFWLGGYLDNETYINIDGTFDHTMLSYDDFEQDLMDHLGYDPHEESLRWDYDDPSQLQAGPQNPPAFPVRGYNTCDVGRILVNRSGDEAQHNGSCTGSKDRDLRALDGYPGRREMSRRDLATSDW